MTQRPFSLREQLVHPLQHPQLGGVELLGDRVGEDFDHLLVGDISG